MTSPGADIFVIYDERYMTDPDRALVVSTADSYREAVEDIEEIFGFPCVIVGPGHEDGTYHMPRAMLPVRESGRQ